MPAKAVMGGSLTGTHRDAASGLINDQEAAAAELAVRVVALAETLGAVEVDPEAGVTIDQVREAFAAFARQGVGRHIGPLPQGLTAEDLAICCRRMLAAVDQSPLPNLEWPAMLAVLGDDLLGRLVDVSDSSLRRYRAGERPTPDPVAERLHVVAQIVSDLSGSYNDAGIRRWFQRPRAQLDGSAPLDVLDGPWSAGDRGVGLVRELAGALLGAALG